MQKTKLVCIIEDDEIHSFILKYQWANSTLHKLITFQSVEEALDELRDKKISPDIFVIDHNLPGMSGLEGISQFKHMFSNALFYAMSSDNSKGTIGQYLKVGVAGYYEKTPEELQALSIQIGIEC